MDVVQVTERMVPGGRLREFTTAADLVISVVDDRAGKVQLAVRRAGADQVDVAADLSPAEAVALAALITGAKVVVSASDDPSDGS